MSSPTTAFSRPSTPPHRHDALNSSTLFAKLDHELKMILNHGHQHAGN